MSLKDRYEFVVQISTELLSFFLSFFFFFGGGGGRIRSTALQFYQEPWINFLHKLSTKKHVRKRCQFAYFELKHISSVRRFLTEDAAKTLIVTSCILSRLDYCNYSHGYT